MISSSLFYIAQKQQCGLIPNWWEPHFSTLPNTLKYPTKPTLVLYIYIYRLRGAFRSTWSYCIFWSASCRAHTSWPCLPGTSRSTCPRWTAPAPGGTRSRCPLRFYTVSAPWPTAPCTGPPAATAPSRHTAPRPPRTLSASTAKAS